MSDFVNNHPSPSERPVGRPGLVSVVRFQWPTIALLAVVGLLAGWFAASAQATTYQATSTVVLVAGEGERDGDGVGALDIDTWSTVARATVLLEQVADDLGLEVADVRDRSSAEAASRGNVIRLRFEAPNEELASEGAAAYGERFLSNRQQAVNAAVRERIETLRSLSVELDGEISERESEIASEDGAVSTGGQLSVLVDAQQSAIAQRAGVEDELARLDAEAETGSVVIDPRSDVGRVGLDPTSVTLVGLLVGALVGLLAALVRGRCDDRYRFSAGAAGLGLSEIGRVPYLDGVASDPAAAQLAYNRLVTRLAFAQPNGEDARSVLVLPVESKTLPFDAGHSIANGIHRFGDRTGLSVALWGEDVALEDTSIHWDETRDAARDFARRHDVVVISERALDHAATGIGLAAIADDTVLVVSESTRLRAIRAALDELRGVGAGPIQILMLTGLRSRDLRGERRPFEDDDAPAPSRAPAAGYDDEYYDT